MFLNKEGKEFKVRVLEISNNRNLLHTVQENETIEQVAKAYNATKEEIIRANNFGGKLEAGDMLLIPKKNKAVYVVKPLDSFASIASKFKVSTAHIKETNNTERLFIGQRLII